MKIGINGAGIAGATLAWWLRRSGHEVLLVEEAPGPRKGGYVVDFWGVGYDVAERMGLRCRLHELGYQIGEVRFVDRRGRQVGGFPTDAFGRITGGRFTTLRRSDLARTIDDALDPGVERVFADSVAGIEDRGNHVRVAFERSAPRDLDLVVGADGLHSRVRRLAFAPDEAFEVPLGYQVAAFEVEGYRPRNELIYVSHAVPGKQVSRLSLRDDRTLFLLVFRDRFLPPGIPGIPLDPRAVLATVFQDVGWECPNILAAMDRAPDVYFDRVSQIRMDRWAKGRTVLVGDAAACVSLLAGEGSGLAMAEAYVLAGELSAAGEPAEALARYQERLAPFLRRKQASAAKLASAFAPKTAAGILTRNLVSWLLRIPFVADLFLGRDLRDDLELPRYEGT